MPITPFPSQGQYPWYDQLEQWGADTQTAAENAKVAADQVHADVAASVNAANQAALDAQVAQSAAVAAAGLVDTPAGDAVLAAVSEGGAARDELEGAISEPNGNVTMRSPVDPLADTKRTRYISYQKQEPTNGFKGGESIWFDTAPLAKSMLTWRLPMNGWAARTVKGAHEGPFNEADWQRVVWAGAHWFAQNQPDDANPTVIHGHWSIETPVPSGELHTRFQVFFNDREDPSKVGSEVALISTNRADFMVERQSTPGGGSGGRFILAGSQSLERMVEISRNDDKLSSRRWAFGANGAPETGANAGAVFQIRRYSDTGDFLGTAINIKRDDGTVTLGSDHWPTPQAPASVLVSPPGGARFGLYVQSRENLDEGFAAIGVRTTQATDIAFSTQAGSGTPHFAVGSDGALSWGSGGSAAPDTRLYRDAAGRIKTDGEFVASSNVRIGTATAAGGVGTLAVGNTGAAPTGATTSAFWMYSEGGVPKFLTKNGIIVKLDQQSAIPNATDSTDAVAKLNDLLLKLRTIGLIAS